MRPMSDEALPPQTRGWLRAAIAGAAPGRVLAATVAAPVVPHVALWRALTAALAGPESGPGLRGVFYQPPVGLGLCGLGAAWQHQVVAEAIGAADDATLRLDGLRAAAGRLFAEMDVRVEPGLVGAPSPRLIGGLSFAAGAGHAAAAQAPWADFGDGRFALPRWCYYSDGERAYLQVALRAGSAAAVQGELAAVEAALCEARRAAAEAVVSPAPDRAAHLQQMDPGAWAAHIEAILHAIEVGEPGPSGAVAFEKIVAARRTRVDLPRALPDTDVLAELVQGQPECTRYAFRCGDATFLGATPERLIARRGDEVFTEALAGTSARGAEARGGASSAAGPAQGLLRSGKDLAEHELVVREILSALSPYCDDLWSAARPVLRRLRDVVHLHTPVRGHLRPDASVSVLELVAALHPTPAVGGTPRRAAQRWIADHEPAWRGWYAGPVGWFDGCGEGEFLVALRCGVLLGAQAHLYVGAGIVDGSDPEREYHETALKQRALLTALGVDPALAEAEAALAGAAPGVPLIRSFAG